MAGWIYFIRSPRDKMTIESRPIGGFPGYRVDIEGGVWSCKDNSGRLTDRWHRLTPDRSKAGYLRVTIHHEGRHRRGLVHQFVLEEFVGPCPQGMEACHSPDPDPGNCRLENLRWDTRKNNRADMKLHGSLPRGESSGQSKLREVDIPRIRRMFYEGMAISKIAAEFGVSGSCIGGVLRGKTWGHVTDGRELVVLPRRKIVKAKPVAPPKPRRPTPREPGYHLSEQHRRNIGLGNLGRVQAESTKAKIGESNRGARHGMAKLGEDRGAQPPSTSKIATPSDVVRPALR